MVHGIANGSKNKKQVDKTDIKWLAKDLNDIKETVENYIDEVRPDENVEAEKTEKKIHTKKMTIDRIIAIIFLGIFGTVVLIAGIYAFIKDPNITTGFLCFIGAVFLICFILFELYRKKN